VVAELARVTLPGRISAVHAADISLSNSGRGDGVLDLPGDIIRLHERHGWRFAGRHFIWKEPLAVRMRTLAKGLAHQTVVEDATHSTIATADQLVLFRRAGENRVPVAHPTGFLAYAGSRLPPADVLRFRDWKGKQTENSYSHWIWRQYASSFWDDIRRTACCPSRRLARRGRRAARPPAPARRDRARGDLVEQPGRAGPHAVHGRRERGLRGGAPAAASAWASS
jgi:hypothetical protein